MIYAYCVLQTIPWKARSKKAHAGNIKIARDCYRRIVERNWCSRVPTTISRAVLSGTYYSGCVTGILKRLHRSNRRRESRSYKCGNVIRKIGLHEVDEVGGQN